MPTILIVDDTAACREPIAAILRRKGYATQCAGDGAEALRLLDTAVPDLVLLDVAMPVMDGVSFLRVIRGDPRWRDLPVILLTAMADRHTAADTTGLNVSVTLLKAQFSLVQLVECVDRHVRQASKPTAA